MNLPKDLPEVIPYWQEFEDAEGNKQYIPNTNIPTPQEIKNTWCFGLPLTKEDGEQMPDSDIKIHIDNAISEVEKRLGVFLKPTVIVTNPEERNIPEDVYEVEEHPYDYDSSMWKQYGFLQLRRRPVISLNTYQMVLPNGLLVVDFYRDNDTMKWVKLDKDNAQINIVPYAGDPTLYAMLGGTSYGFPFVTGTLTSNLPHMFYVDYVAGYKQYQIPHEIREVICKITAIKVLGIAGDAVMVGISSISTSVDGLSESTSLTAGAQYATYGAHIHQYKEEVKEFFNPKHGGGRTAYRGITMTGL